MERRLRGDEIVDSDCAPLCTRCPSRSTTATWVISTFALDCRRAAEPLNSDVAWQIEDIIVRCGERFNAVLEIHVAGNESQVSDRSSTIMV